MSNIPKTKTNRKISTYDTHNNLNGYLIPIYNYNEHFHENGKEPKQVYLTVIQENKIKGPHLHYIRTGFFTCIKGNIRIILRINESFKVYYSGENYNYMSIIVPCGIPAAIQNIGPNDAFVLNMPSPAWTPDMNDEHTADFADFNFNEI